MPLPGVGSEAVTCSGSTTFFVAVVDPFESDGVPTFGGVTSGGAVTTTFTDAVPVVVPLSTVSWNVSVAGVAPVVSVGATKDGCAVAAPVSCTVVPAVCVHANVSGAGGVFGSALAVPSSVTFAPEPTLCVTPAFAIGGHALRA